MGRRRLRAAVDASLSAMAAVGAPTTWVLSNHDVPRVVTRYGGGQVGTAAGPGGRAAVAGAARRRLPLQRRGTRAGGRRAARRGRLQDPQWHRSGGAAGRAGIRSGCRCPGPARQPPFGFPRRGPAVAAATRPAGRSITVAAQRPTRPARLNRAPRGAAVARDVVRAPFGRRSFRWLPRGRRTASAFERADAGPSGCAAW